MKEDTQCQSQESGKCNKRIFKDLEGSVNGMLSKTRDCYRLKRKEKI